MIPSDTDIQRTISETHDSLRNIEATSERINSILREPQREITTAEIQKNTFSAQFTSFIMVCLVASLGMLGVLFYNATSQQSADIDRLSSRINTLEVRFATLSATVTAEHKYLMDPHPSHNSTK